MLPKHPPYIKFIEKQTKSILSVIRQIDLSPTVLGESYTLMYSDKPDGKNYFTEVIYKSGEFYLCFNGVGGNYMMDLYYPANAHNKSELLIKSLKKKNI